MMDRKVQMMDAGMRLFESEKPIGNVLGGIKNEMGHYGRLMRRNEIDPEGLPPTTGDCDLLLDRSTKVKSKYLSCRVEDAGIVGKTADGEDIHRYAVSLKEGNRNTRAGISFAIGFVAIWFLLGWLITGGNAVITVIFTVIGLYGAWLQLRPSKDNLTIANKLLDIFAEGK